MTPDYDTAVAYAAALGTEHGTNAAGWYTQDTIGGRASGDVGAVARRIIDGIDAGDPIIQDGFPAPDLSGQWADTLTGPQLIIDALDAAGHPRTLTHGDTYGACQWQDRYGSDICDAYEDAYRTAAESAIAAACMAVLA